MRAASFKRLLGAARAAQRNEHQDLVAGAICGSTSKAPFCSKIWGQLVNYLASNVVREIELRLESRIAAERGAERSCQSE